MPCRATWDAAEPASFPCYCTQLYALVAATLVLIDAYVFFTTVIENVRIKAACETQRYARILMHSGLQLTWVLGEKGANKIIPGESRLQGVDPHKMVVAAAAAQVAAERGTYMAWVHTAIGVWLLFNVMLNRGCLTSLALPALPHCALPSPEFEDLCRACTGAPLLTTCPCCLLPADLMCVFTDPGCTSAANQQASLSPLLLHDNHQTRWKGHEWPCLSLPAFTPVGHLPRMQACALSAGPPSSGVV